MLSFFAICLVFIWLAADTCKGLFRELNPGPLAPEARIMPLDQTASCKRAEARGEKRMW